MIVVRSRNGSDDRSGAGCDAGSGRVGGGDIGERVWGCVVEGGAVGDGGLVGDDDGAGVYRCGLSG